MKFRFRRQGNDPHREKIKQDLFAFSKTVEHGFPNQPSALAYDPKRQLLAIGTKSGAMKIYGAPGVEMTGLHKDTAAVTQIHFLYGQGRILSLLDDNTIHLWEIVQRENRSHLVEVHSFNLPGRPGIESFLNLQNTPNKSLLFVMLFTCLVIPLFSVPEEYKCGKSLGPVESLQEHPQDSDKILIGYSRGLVVLWDLNSRHVVNLFLGKQQLESLVWERSGNSFVSSHSDGGYMVWAVSSSNPCTHDPISSTVPYGEPKHMPITHIFTYFSLVLTITHRFGGMPRASYGDRHCLTILQDSNHVTLDFTSRVIDFFTIHCTDKDKEFDDPSALVVLLEEELIVIDLQMAGWPTVPAPYLAPLHSSAITCSCHISNVLPKLWERVISAGHGLSELFSSQKELLLTGHEDGTVRFWDASGVSLKPLYKLSTANIFQTDCDHNDSLTQAGEEEWPPFRKVGCFDPYSDDPRLGIQKISVCKYSGKLVVAGTAGQVIVMVLSDEKSDHMIDVATVDLLQDREGFTWKGHDRLPPKSGSVVFAPGFQPVVLVQCMPPAAVTAVTLHAEWNLIAFGTSHGFGLFDYHRRSPVLARCTLHPNDSLAMEGPLSRVKSLKKSLRQSFRRIRKSRVSGKKRAVVYSPTNKVSVCLEISRTCITILQVLVTPVQRRIEPRSADDSLSGVVRCLCFADTFLRDGTHHGPTMWAGTNSGSVYAYALDVPSQEKFSEQSVEALLGKEIQLMHRAPVVSIAVLDGRGNPLPEPYEVSRDLAKAPDMQGSHSVLIASEEQFKVFMLPKVSAKTKFKLTAHEGCRVRKVALSNFTSVSSEEYSENALVCLTNLGDIHMFSVPALRPQVRYDCIRKEDISGIASCVFTKTGQGFYLISPSEYERFSLSARLLDEMRSALSSPVLDSPNSSADITLDTTGELTVEDVKDFLMCALFTDLFWSITVEFILGSPQCFASLGLWMKLRITSGTSLKKMGGLLEFSSTEASWQTAGGEEHLQHKQTRGTAVNTVVCEE
uniref:LLGL scribble cell polarity complex component 1 n=1 Tax=Sinocyclocheilus grahami TaxID=75366 RepID=A0A672RS07_SINGR